MFTRILRHEWRLLTADGAIWLTVVIGALAIGYGTFNGVRWISFQQAAIAETAREERERFAAQEATIARITAGEMEVSPFADPRNPQAAASRLGARYAVMPPAPLAAFSIGQSDLLPYYVRVTSDARETVTAGVELENPHRLLTGRFDLAFVLIYLYPLLIVAISYNVLSGEKEQGTLVLALSQPLNLRTFTLGKLALRFAVFLVGIAVLAGAAIAMAGIDLTAPGALLHVAWWYAAVMAYGLVWFGLVVLVASFGRSSSTNAMALAALWLAGVILVPSLLNMLATAVYPVPSRVEMIQAVREASDDASQQGSALLARYYEDHPELAVGGAEQAMNDFNVIRIAVGAEVEDRVRPVLDRYASQLAGQQRLVARLRVLSPAVLMQEALNDISGTGVPRHQHFMQQVADYHDRWRAYFVPLIVRQARLERYDTLPVFSYADEPAGLVIARVRAAIALMMSIALVVGVIGVLRLRRYAVV